MLWERRYPVRVRVRDNFWPLSQFFFWVLVAVQVEWVESGVREVLLVVLIEEKMGTVAMLGKESLHSETEEVQLMTLRWLWKKLMQSKEALGKEQVPCRRLTKLYPQRLEQAQVLPRQPRFLRPCLPSVAGALGRSRGQHVPSSVFLPPL